MLQIMGRASKACDGLTRRALLQAGGLALLTGLASTRPAIAAPSRRSAGGVKSVVLIDLFGGPSHLDMFDPKPDAPAEIRGEFQSIRTSLPGVLVSEHLPRMSHWLDPTLPSLEATVTLDALDRRRTLLEQVNQQATRFDSSASMAGMGQRQREAFDLLINATSRSAFDLSQEPASIRERYGRDLFGSS